jgi:hypothetical protein
MALGRFEVAARVGTGSGSGVSVVTGRTEPLPPETGQAEAIRDRSAQRYGTPPSDPEPPTPKAADEVANERPPGRTGRAS